MKKKTIALLVAACATVMLSYGQDMSGGETTQNKSAIANSTQNLAGGTSATNGNAVDGADERIVKDEPRLVNTIEGDWSDWVEYDRKDGKTTLSTADGIVQRINGKLHLGKLKKGQTIRNYFLNKKTGVGIYKEQWFNAGTRVWFDENGVPIAKFSCTNPLSVPITQKVGTKEILVYMQRERTNKEIWQQDIHHYPKETPAKPCEQPRPLYALRPRPSGRRSLAMLGGETNHVGGATLAPPAQNISISNENNNANTNVLTVNDVINIVNNNGGGNAAGSASGGAAGSGTSNAGGH